MLQTTLPAFQDLLQALKRYKLWLYLGWSDIKLRYKGSILGPFWITLSMAVFILAIGIVYSHLLKIPLETYIPYLTSGLLVWNYISLILIDCNDIFFNSKHFINHIPLPYSLYLYRVVWRNIIIFLHNLLVYLLVMLYFHLPIDWQLLLFVPGFTLLTLTLTFLGLFIALIGTRYRDIPPIINSVIQIIFFISPIAWTTDDISINSLWVRINPVTYFLDIVRSPLLGQRPHETSWLICSIIAICSVILIVPIFAMNRKRIPFWL
jgi:ABC-type polysaccharide/polyol phosphate export permease